MASDLRITTVRHGPEKARELLRGHVFGGKYKIPRVPRGIDPAFVSRFIIEEIKPDSPRDAYQKTLEVVRFYERQDVVDHLMRALSRREAEFVDLMRSLYALQAAGDVGNQTQRQAAAQYLDGVIVPHPKADLVHAAIGETAVTLAPTGTTAAWAKRIERDINLRAPHQDENEESMMAYDKAVEVKEQLLPGAEAEIAGKQKLFAKKPPERAPDLVQMYQGSSPLSGTYMRTWAARQIRFDAAAEGFGLHKPLFLKEIDAIDPKAEPTPESDLKLVRAIQAIMYFQESPRMEDLERYAKARARPGIHMNFLWDDDE